ncbi:MAG: fibronectin type III domain-containing protein, partial [Planctomycetes bacterium]|nr:fibronectin type III domain-containing protein [Planctomycetota bacterium]
MNHARRSSPAPRAGLLGLVLLALGALPSAAEEVRLPALKDNSIVLHPGEYRINAGSAERIRIKGNQHLVALGFDATPLRGRTIASATLVCTQADAVIAGVTISTIAADWDEMISCAVTSGVGPNEGWGAPGVWFPAVCGGNSFSLLCQAQSEPQNGIYRWAVHPDLVYALALGAATGLALHEHGCDYSRNPTIFAREARGKEPYLLVALGGTEPKPEAPTELRVTSGGDPDSLRLHLRAPKQGFAYEVKVGGSLLPRWNVPFVAAGRVQVIPLRDLPLKPGMNFTVSVTTVSRTGVRSPAATVEARVQTLMAPEAPPPAPAPSAPAAPTGSLAACAFPVEDRYDAAGKPVGNLPEGYAATSELCAGGPPIRLRAARGEVVGFQVILAGKGEVTVACTLPGARVDLFAAVQVQSELGLVPDPLVPLTKLQLRETVGTPVVADVYVPFDCTARELTGRFTVSDGRSLPVTLAVRGFALPRKASFLCEMNGYGMPDSVADFYQLQQVAYDHRVHVNLLYYGHDSTAPGARNSHLDLRLPDGRRMDEKRFNDIGPGAQHAFWDDFVKAFGPYLTGACFREGHRGPIPAPGFYLSFHESWPLKVRGFFNGDPDAYRAFAEKPVYAATF